LHENIILMNQSSFEDDKVKDCAKVFGLKTIPFNPSGTETGEYPFVRSDDFDTILNHAKELESEKKNRFSYCEGSSRRWENCNYLCSIK